MNDLQKVLVVDSGERGTVDSLSAELAELGYSSVTTSYEAADQVLELIRRPSAIFLNMPQPGRASEYAKFLAVADVLRERESVSGIPVMVWDRSAPSAGMTVSAMLESSIDRTACDFSIK